MRPNRFQVVWSLSKVTAREILRDKVLYNVLLITLFLFGLTFLASQFTFGRTDRMVLDFGLSALRLSGAMIALFNGAAMVGHEYERRTVWVALSRPISHFQWIWGKYFGLLGVILLNHLVLTGVLMGMLYGVTDSISILGHPTLLWALLFAGVEAAVLGSIAVFCSAFTTTSLSVILGMGLYLIGHNLSVMVKLAEKLKKQNIEGSAAALQAIVVSLPRFEGFNLSTRATYQLPVPTGEALLALVYAVCWVVLFLGCSGALLRRRML